MSNPTWIFPDLLNIRHLWASFTTTSLIIVMWQQVRYWDPAGLQLNGVLMAHSLKLTLFLSCKVGFLHSWIGVNIFGIIFWIIHGSGGFLVHTSPVFLVDLMAKIPLGLSMINVKFGSKKVPETWWIHIEDNSPVRTVYSQDDPVFPYHQRC